MADEGNALMVRDSMRMVGWLGVGIFALVGCSSSSDGDGAESGTGAATAVASKTPTPAQKKVDDQCFVSFTHAAGQCNTSAGNDDAAFDKCLAPVRANLKSCCANGGSSECAADATPSEPTPAQKEVDDRCFVNFTHASSECNTKAGDDDAAFDACFGPVKDALKSCCADGGSSECAADAADPPPAGRSEPTAEQKAIDDACFVSFTHASGQCNTTAGNDDAAFDKCFAPVKAALATCCANGGSAECANP
jgi:hypothetical protein